MKFIDFIKGKIVFILFQILLIIFISLLLHLYKVSFFGIFLTIFSISILTIFEILYEYLNRNSFYKTLNKILNNLDKKCYISEIIERPNFIDGKILYDTLKISNKSMNDEIAIYRKANKDYKEYIETWIHEIKIPISTIHLLCENSKLNKKDIKYELNRINDYVEQALYYAKSTNLEEDYIIKEFNLDNFIKKVIKNKSQILISNNAKIELNNLNYNIYSDSKWLEFIINQIISNSIKYKKEDLKLEIFAKENKNNIILTIKDNGIGIDVKDLNKVFYKGYTGDNGRKYSKSTGIGLYLCKTLCDKMYIGLKINSKKNEYTDVTLIFPKDRSLFKES